MSDDDWLNTDDSPVDLTPAALPSVGTIIPEDMRARIELHDAAWSRLKPKQKVFLTTWRECGFNTRKAERILKGTPNAVSRVTTQDWCHNPDYAFVKKVLETTNASSVLIPEKLILRQDDIVEQLLEPTPILHQGMPTGFYENRAPAAAKANEKLMEAAGILKGEQKAARVTVRVVNLAGFEQAVDAEVINE